MSKNNTPIHQRPAELLQNLIRFDTTNPLERILVKSVHGEIDPPAAIPCRVEWVEYLAAQQCGIEVKDSRRLIWKNFARILHETNTTRLLPDPLTKLLAHRSLGRESIFFYNQGESHAH